MTCLTDGVLRAKLDGELSEVESLEAQNHLAACPDCRRRAEAIAVEAERVRGALSALDPLPSEAPGEARTAFARFRAEHAEPPAQAPSLAGRLFARRLRPVWGAVAALAAVAVFLSFAPARGWGQKILAMLRVQKIAVVTIDPEVLSSGRKGDDKGRSIGRLMSDNLVVTMDPGKPQHVSSVDEASQLAGFPVRALTGLSEQPQLSVEGEGAFHMTLNRDRLQAILDEAGRPDLQLPEALDGATIAVHVPKAAFVRYGNCAEPKSDRPAPGGRGGEAAPDSAPKGPEAQGCTFLAQVPSPTVSVPPDLNIAQVAEAGLQLAGMSADAAHAFCQTVDWTSTLVIPIPRDATSYQTVEVDGVQGTFINRPQWGRRPAGYNLLWVKNGVIHSLVGRGDAATAVALADSLQ
ncbi:MAG: hypothetical protein DMG25_01930 [Acidobacteria bacterium]|nr:MAG: hypothetical protein DMG25_01930 [Acidobacteriota bacterium]